MGGGGNSSRAVPRVSIQIQRRGNCLHKGGVTFNVTKCDVVLKGTW